MSESATATTATPLGNGTGVNFFAFSRDASKEITGLPSFPITYTRGPARTSEASSEQASSAILVRPAYVSCSGVSILEGWPWTIGTTWPIAQFAFEPQPNSFCAFLLRRPFVAAQASACTFEHASSSTFGLAVSILRRLKLHL